MSNISKRSPTIRITDKLKRRLEAAKGPDSYSDFITKILREHQKDGPRKITLHNNLEISCPVLLRLDETCYCIKNPPKAPQIKSLKICEICAAMKRYDSILDLMKKGYAHTFKFPSCGGALRDSKGQTWVQCPPQGSREVIFPNFCENTKCARLKSKTIKIDLDLEAMK